MSELLREGASANSKDFHGRTRLHNVCMTSVEGNSAGAANILLRWGAEGTATDDDGHTPGDLIDSNSDPTGPLWRLLANAPADRAWRCRGIW